MRKFLFDSPAPVPSNDRYCWDWDNGSTGLSWAWSVSFILTETKTLSLKINKKNCTTLQILTYKDACSRCQPPKNCVRHKNWFRKLVKVWIILWKIPKKINFFLFQHCKMYIFRISFKCKRCLGKVSIEKKKKKKCELSHFWSRLPLPKKCET